MALPMPIAPISPSLEAKEARKFGIGSLMLYDVGSYASLLWTVGLTG